MRDSFSSTLRLSPIFCKLLVSLYEWSYYKTGRIPLVCQPLPALRHFGEKKELLCSN